MREQWMFILGYDWKYAVSDHWNVISFRTNKILKPLNKRGYLSVALSLNGKVKHYQIHRLVGEAFLKGDKPFINHIDWDKTNNHCSNLERVTRSENELHAYATWLKTANKTWTGRFWENHPNHRVINQIDRRWNILWTFNWFHEANRETGVRYQDIRSVCNGRRKTAGWFIWAYA